MWKYSKNLKVTDLAVPHFIFRSEVFMSFIRTRGMPAGMSQEKEFQGIQYSLLRDVSNKLAKLGKPFKKKLGFNEKLSQNGYPPPPGLYL